MFEETIGLMDNFVLSRLEIVLKAIHLEGYLGHHFLAQEWY